jgi:nicotinamide-nucleotide amidase
MVYSKEILDRIKDRLIEKKQTLAVAESVTSGHLQAAFSTATDAALFFQGGITSYNLGQKCRQLAVEPIHALDCDCVSADIAQQMAESVCLMFLSDYGIGITGYATPVPEKNIETLFAFVCIVHRGEVVLSRKITPGDATAFDAQVNFTNCVLEELLAVI